MRPLIFLLPFLVLISCDKEDMSEEIPYNSYILYNDQYYELRDSCFYSTLPGTFTIILNSPRIVSDPSKVELLCYGDLLSGDSTQVYSYGDINDEIWNTFTNYSFVSLPSYINRDETGYWLAGGKVRIYQRSDEWEITMNCVFDLGDSVFVRLKGIPFTFNLN